MLNTRYLYIVFTFGLALSAMGRELSLNDALTLALAENKNIQIARADVQYSDALIKEAWSTALPQVNIAANYNRNLMDNFFYITVTDSLGNKSINKFDMTFKNQFALNAQLTQTIYSFGKIGTALDIAYDFESYSALQFEEQQNMILTQVKKAYYRTLLAAKVVEVAEESERSALENYENVKIRFEGGLVSEFDLLQAEVRWQNAIPNTLEAHKNYELATNNLKLLLNLPIQEPIEVKWDMESYPEKPEKLPVEQVLEIRPGYLALLLEQQMRRKNVKIEFANHLPTIYGSVNYTYAANSDEFRLDNDNDNLILGVGINFPIFSGGYTSAQVQKARIDVEKIDKQVELNQDNIRIDLQNVYLRMDEADSRIDAAQKSVNSARRAFEIAESRYNNGLATQLELKDSRIFLDQAQITYLTAIYAYLEAYFDWELLTGKVSITNENN